MACSSRQRRHMLSLNCPLAQAMLRRFWIGDACITSLVVFEPFEHNPPPLRWIRSGSAVMRAQKTPTLLYFPIKGESK
jgi:hypothetical protein